ncbi:MAG: PEP-CTERM sorting domain-containing protein [Planctomycetota bacterium]|nr:PEP-CTERM sorting domain-containing protein [Planctomycetota bacterium]
MSRTRVPVVLVCICCGFANTLAADIFRGLVGYWPFEDAGGSFVSDFSGNGNKGTVHGTVAAPGARGGTSLSFNGSSDYIDIPNAPLLNPTAAVTVTAWVRADTISTWPAIVKKAGEGTAQQHGYTLECESRGVRMLADLPGGLWQGATPFRPLPLNQWVFCAGVYDGSVFTMYTGDLGNAPVGQSQTSTGGPVDVSANNLNIGRDPSNPTMTSRFFDGRIDEVRLYNRALTAAEVREVYDYVPAAAVYNVHQDTSTYGHLNQNDVPGIGAVACGPAASVNSLAHLENVYPGIYGGRLVPVQSQDLNNDGSVTSYDHMIGTVQTLAQPQYMDTAANGGTYHDDLIWGMQHYIETTSPGHTTYRAQDSWAWDDPSRPKPGFVTTQYPTWRFLYDELSAGKDLAVLLSWSGGGHFVTLTGMYWKDSDIDGVIDPGEATIQYVDPWTGSVTTKRIHQPFANGEVHADDVFGNDALLTAAFSQGIVGIPGDANLDCEVGPEDFALLKDNFGRDGLVNGWGLGDFNGDGEVGPEDFAVLKDHFGRQAGSPLVTAPEPATLSLLALAGLAILRNRRK